MKLMSISCCLCYKHPAKKYKTFTDKQTDQNDVISRHKHFIIRVCYVRRDLPRLTTYKNAMSIYYCNTKIRHEC